MLRSAVKPGILSGVMPLYQALHVKPNDVVSFVGAGGKTTAALRLMEELAGIQRRVVFTTTTKILEPIPRENEYRPVS